MVSTPKPLGLKYCVSFAFTNFKCTILLFVRTPKISMLRVGQHLHNVGELQSVFCVGVGRHAVPCLSADPLLALGRAARRRPGRPLGTPRVHPQLRLQDEVLNTYLLRHSITNMLITLSHLYSMDSSCSKLIIHLSVSVVSQSPFWNKRH